ncbi:MAG TPA: PIG-L deacetylase family protein [Solirubrobacteraceae bacterium]
MDPLTAVARAGATEVLVLLAHPDDEVLLCGGTIAALVDAGCDVHVVCFCACNRGRNDAFPRACAQLGATGELLAGHSDSGMVLDGELVAVTDGLIRERRPGCVITHTKAGSQNQDHAVLHEAVRMSAVRCSAPTMLLAAEPPLSSAGFAPSLFIDVEPYFKTKCSAIEPYRELFDRDYMTDEYMRIRARWWGQVAGRAGALVEAYELVLWR